MAVWSLGFWRSIFLIFQFVFISFKMLLFEFIFYIVNIMFFNVFTGLELPWGVWPPSSLFSFYIHFCSLYVLIKMVVKSPWFKLQTKHRCRNSKMIHYEYFGYYVERNDETLKSCTNYYYYFILSFWNKFENALCI